MKKVPSRDRDELSACALQDSLCHRQERKIKTKKIKEQSVTRFPPEQAQPFGHGWPETGLACYFNRFPCIPKGFRYNNLQLIFDERGKSLFGGVCDDLRIKTIFQPTHQKTRLSGAIAGDSECSAGREAVPKMSTLSGMKIFYEFITFSFHDHQA